LASILFYFAFVCFFTSAQNLPSHTNTYKIPKLQEEEEEEEEDEQEERLAQKLCCY
jgi:hypothetical protein